MSGLKYRSDIDGLRALAVLAVVAFHAFPSALPGGFVGVDIFFVISGFLISGLILKELEAGTFTFAGFYARRVRRIFPALSIVVGSCLVFGWWALLADEYVLLAKHAGAAAGFFANLVFIREAGYFDVSAELKPLLHLWSLSVEEQFYLFWPLALVLVYRHGLNVLSLIISVAALAFLFNLGTINGNPAVAFFSLHTRMWELGLGCLLAYAGSARLDRWVARFVFDPERPARFAVDDVKAVLGVALLSLAFLVIDRERRFPGWWAILPTIGAYLLIASPGAWLNRKVLSSPALVFIGLVSYPLYLWHWPLLSFARITEAGEPSVWLKLFIIAAAFLLAWLTYVLVEKPIRRNRLLVPAAAMLLIVAGVALQVYRSAGYAERVEHLAKNAEAVEWKNDNIATHSCKSEWMHFTNVRYCLRTRPGTAPTVAIVGDSKANMYFIGLSKTLIEENVFNVGKGGCAPFYDLEGPDPQLKHQCAGVMNEVLDFVTQRASIHTVILTSRNPYYRARNETYTARYFSAMRETIKRLQAGGKRVVFLVDLPAMEFEPTSCVDIRPLKVTATRSPCATPLELAESKAYRQEVASLLKEFPAVVTYDPATDVCDSEKCWAMRDGRMLYRDADHLSAYGSEVIGERIAERLGYSPLGNILRNANLR